MNSRLIPPWRNRSVSSMLSAPATIPATNAATFSPACAPLSVGTVSCCSARARSPTRSASASTGTSPPADTRPRSSNRACPDRAA